jgi:uncharacterized protein (DUF934 family)
MALWRNGAFAADDAVTLADDAPLTDGPVLVSLKRFLADRDTLLVRNAPVGVVLQPADKLDAIATDLPNLPLLALTFPKFADGRAFSQARLARERYGFAGELRAVGDILFDRIAYMIRCGFDSLDITNEPTIAELRAGRVPLAHQRYQPTGGDHNAVDPLKPWRRLA